MSIAEGTALALVAAFAVMITALVLATSNGATNLTKHVCHELTTTDRAYLACVRARS